MKTDSAPHTGQDQENAASVQTLVPQSDGPILVSPQTSSLETETTSLQSGTVGKDEFLHLHATFKRLERLKWIVLISVVGFVSLSLWVAIACLNADILWPSLWIWLLMILAGLCALVAAGIYFPKWQFESTTWRLSSHGLEIRHGICWQHRIFVPRDHIQHTDVQQGPLMRVYGLACLVINTGGTHEPSIPLEGLSLEVAEQIRDQLNGKSIDLSNTPSEPKTLHAEPN